MSKLRDRLHFHHEAPEHPAEAPERVPESPEVVEHHKRVTAPPAEATRGVRWLRLLRPQLKLCSPRPSSFCCSAFVWI